MTENARKAFFMQNIQRKEVKPSIAILFITLNEEFHIGAAIDNVKDIANEIFVVDSLSTDKTVEIALAKGAKVVQRPFKDFGDQWNFALSLPIESQWTMKMDPDERLSDDLKNEIIKNIADPKDYVGFSVSWMIHFLGRPIRCKSYHFLRIWKTGSCRFTPVIVNEHPIVKGKVRKLASRLIHLDSRDMHAWIDKQNRYSSQEALSRYLNKDRAAKPRLFGNVLERRVWFSNVFWHVPGRYQILFLINFILKGAWRSGIDGWRWAVMRSFVKRAAEYKWREMENTGREVHIPCKEKKAFRYHPAVLSSELQQKYCPESLTECNIK